jgi:predicted CoA-binding protein
MWVQDQAFNEKNARLLRAAGKKLLIN